MTQHRYGSGGVTGRRIVDDVSKRDGEHRGRRAAVGGAAGAVGLHAASAGMATHLGSIMEGSHGMTRGEVFRRDAKNFGHAMNPVTVARGMKKYPRYGAALGVAGLAGAGLGAASAGKKPVKKADWMGIEEHKRRSRDSRRTKATGGMMLAGGVAGSGIVATNYPGAAKELRDISRTARGRVTPQHYGEEPHEFSVRDRSGKMSASAGQRVRNVVRSAKVRPGGAVLGGSLALAGAGAGVYGAGRLNERRHDMAVARLRRQRATSSVGKAVTFGGIKRVVGAAAKETHGELKQTFRPFSASDKLGAHALNVHPMRVRAAETLLTRPKATAALGAGAYLGAYNLGNVTGGMRGRRSAQNDFGKRYRDYNGEHRRQRRIGMAEAAAIGGGGTALGFGGHGTYKDTKSLRDMDLRDIKGKTSTKLGKTPIGRGAVVLSRKNGALILGGGAALGGAAALRRWAEGNRGRAYS